MKNNAFMFFLRNVQLTIQFLVHGKSLKSVPLYLPRYYGKKHPWTKGKEFQDWRL